jgi:hypothetical protein
VSGILRPVLGRVKRGLARRLGLMPIPAPVPVPVLQPPPPVWAGRAGGPIAAVDMDECQAFFGYLRIHAYAVVAGAEQHGGEALRAGVRVGLEIDGIEPVQRGRVLSVQPSLAVEFELDALVEGGFAMERAFLLVWFRDELSRFPMKDVLPYARARDLRTQLVEFRAMTRQLAADEGRRPTLLDVGGRARSHVQKSEDFPHCDVTVFDIVPDPGVDVVGDAHEMSRHLAADSFDFAQSLAVFEHLLMPWKVAVELNRVLKPGGICYIWAPQTHALHDLPWDFFRFSDSAWAALFNAHTGFEILGTDMSLQVHVVPRVFPETPADPEHTAGFMACGVIARKIGPARVDWPVPLRDVIATSYPLDEPGAHPHG